MIFFSFDKYEFIDFQIQTSYKICTKVRHKIWMFEINFCNHTFALKEFPSSFDRLKGEFEMKTTEK